MQQQGRFIENALAVLGGLMAAAYVGLVEILPRACYALGRCAREPTNADVPWGVVIVVGALVLPKTVGRATAGKVWEGIATRLGRRPSRTTTEAPDEPADK